MANSAAMLCLRASRYTIKIYVYRCTPKTVLMRHCFNKLDLSRYVGVEHQGMKIYTSIWVYLMHQIIKINTRLKCLYGMCVKIIYFQFHIRNIQGALKFYLSLSTLLGLFRVHNMTQTLNEDIL